jgi:DNA-binding MarR family transcriptional regulator
MSIQNKPLEAETAEWAADIEERISREERVLFWLLKHPFQRMEDLAFALGCHRTSIGRYLHHLEERHLVERLSPSFGRTQTSACLYLTTRGIEHVAARVGAVPAKLAALWGADEAGLLRLLPRLSGLMLLQDVVNGLVEQAPGRLAPSGSSSIALRWHWQRDYRPTFLTKGKRWQASVDAALVMVQHTEGEAPRYWCVLLLLDEGWEGQSDLALMKDRLIHLLRWRESGGRWASYQHFPPLLILTTSSRNQDHWQQATQQTARQMRLAPVQGAVATLQREDAGRAAWHLAWQSLSEAVPSPLWKVWQPMSREAVPPDLLAPRTLPVGLFTQEGPTSSRSIVRGHFARRAAEPLPTASIPRTQKECQLVAWIGLRLTRKQQEILLQVYAHPLLAPHELAVLLDMQTETLLRALAPLRGWGCLQRMATEMGERLVLGERGIRLLAAQHAVAVTHLAESRHHLTDPLSQRGVPYLRQTMRHAAGIYRFVVQLTQAAREQEHRLLWWETGARCARRYRYRGAWHNLLPDARLAYDTGTETIHCWLEWDEGTMRQRSLATKLHTYEQYIKTRQWRQDETVIPLLLVVVPDPGQEHRLCHLAATLLHEMPLQVYVTTASRLEREGPLAPIWLQPSNWRQERSVTRQAWV